jgi:hypothetical protein
MPSRHRWRDLLYRWPETPGITGRIAVEWVAGLPWNPQLIAAGEKIYFPYIPESLQDAFGGAKTIGEIVASNDHEAPDS